MYLQDFLTLNRSNAASLAVALSASSGGPPLVALVIAGKTDCLKATVYRHFCYRYTSALSVVQRAVAAAVPAFRGLWKFPLNLQYEALRPARPFLRTLGVSTPRVAS